MTPEFLTLDDVLLIHADQVTRYGGDRGVRDLGLLESAVAMPGATFDGQFLHRDVYEMAAAYVFHIVQNHPFVDGNKRTGTAASLVFLELNGSPIDIDERELVELILAVAQHQVGKQDIARAFREHA